MINGYENLMLSGGAFALANRLTVDGKIEIKSIPYTRSGDELFSFIMFLRRHGRKPTSGMIFNDVLYRIKTSQEILNPLRVFVSDKEFLKIFVKAVVGDEYNVPTFGIIRHANILSGFEFPDDCVVKPTHASGLVQFAHQNSKINFDAVASWFAINYYRKTREANYKYLTPKIIIEPRVFSTDSPLDYKFFCFDGRARLVQVDVARQQGHKKAFFDRSWVRQRFTINKPMFDGFLERPANYGLMLEVVEAIARNFGFVRVDLYSDGKSIYVGEITNCHGNASQVFSPLSAEFVASRILFGG